MSIYDWDDRLPKPKTCAEATNRFERMMARGDVLSLPIHEGPHPSLTEGAEYCAAADKNGWWMAVQREDGTWVRVLMK